MPKSAANNTKQEIFLAALELFSTEGYANVSMAQLAKAVGLSPSSIYNHFTGKDAILEHMFRYYKDNSTHFHTPFDELFEYMDRHGPIATLHRIVYVFPKDIEANMYRVLNIASSLTGDVRAKLLLDQTFTHYPTLYCTTLLNRMLEKDMIEPLDVEAFAMAYSCVCRSSTLQMLSAHPFSHDLWWRVINQLFECITVKNPQQWAASDTANQYA